jgi:hypothetical protein
MDVVVWEGALMLEFGFCDWSCTALIPKGLEIALSSAGARAFFLFLFPIYLCNGSGTS